MADSTARRRGPKPSSSPPKSTTTTDEEPEDSTSRVISPLDLLRVLLTLILASCLLSYYLTSGSSFLFNYNPWFLNVSKLSSWWAGPLVLTPAQLALFNGTDSSKPIYL